MSQPRRPHSNGMGEPRHATGIFIGRCANPDCRSLHLDLVDGDEVFACAAIPVSQLKLLTEHLHGIAYEIATENEA